MSNVFVEELIETSHLALHLLELGLWYTRAPVQRLWMTGLVGHVHTEHTIYMTSFNTQSAIVRENQQGSPHRTLSRLRILPSTLSIVGFKGGGFFSSFLLVASLF